MRKEPFIGISRLRLKTDGQGVTTLVAFHGCPLHCKYCLNPQCLRDDGKHLMFNEEEVLRILKKDELYFLATRGGVTFGGGEPLLKADFIRNVLELGAKEWHTTLETSLNVPTSNIEKLFPYIDEYIVDIKDINSQTYKSYTGVDNNQVIINIKWLIAHGKMDNIICRIPLILGFNTIGSQIESREFLRKLGIHRFDLFEYKTEIKK